MAIGDIEKIKELRAREGAEARAAGDPNQPHMQVVRGPAEYDPEREIREAAGIETDEDFEEARDLAGRLLAAAGYNVDEAKALIEAVADGDI